MQTTLVHQTFAYTQTAPSSPSSQVTCRSFCFISSPALRSSCPLASSLVMAWCGWRTTETKMFFVWKKCQCGVHIVDALSTALFQPEQHVFGAKPVSTQKLSWSLLQKIRLCKNRLHSCRLTVFLRVCSSISTIPWTWALRFHRFPWTSFLVLDFGPPW